MWLNNWSSLIKKKIIIIIWVRIYDTAVKHSPSKGSKLAAALTRHTNWGTCESFLLLLILSGICAAISAIDFVRWWHFTFTAFWKCTADILLILWCSTSKTKDFFFFSSTGDEAATCLINQTYDKITRTPLINDGEPFNFSVFLFQGQQQIPSHPSHSDTFHILINWVNELIPLGGWGGGSEDGVQSAEVSQK